MSRPRLYDDLAWLWPLLSPPGDYLAEAATLNTLIETRLGPGPKRILELGAGGGHTLVHLCANGAEESRAVGGWGGVHEGVAVDLSEPMLANCRALIPGVQTVVGDMRDVRLGATFDVVLVHDAIDYLLTEDDLVRTFETIRHHLRPGGLAFVAPTYTAETFTDGEVADDGTGTDAEELTYFTYVHDPDPADTAFEMILLYLIRARKRDAAGGRPVEVVEDRHRCGLFPTDTWLGLMERAGLTAELIEQGARAWSLFLGTRTDDAAGN